MCEAGPDFAWTQEDDEVKKRTGKGHQTRGDPSPLVTVMGKLGELEVGARRRQRQAALQWCLLSILNKPRRGTERKKPDTELYTEAKTPGKQKSETFPWFFVSARLYPETRRRAHEGFKGGKNVTAE